MSGTTTENIKVFVDQVADHCSTSVFPCTSTDLGFDLVALSQSRSPVPSRCPLGAGGGKNCRINFGAKLGPATAASKSYFLSRWQ